jgi:hypothetical protein
MEEPLQMAEAVRQAYIAAALQMGRSATSSPDDPDPRARW